MKNLIRYFTLRKRIKAKIRECESKIVDLHNWHDVNRLSSDQYLATNRQNLIYENIIKILKEIL
jgi:hypothetical protein